MARNSPGGEIVNVNFFTTTPSTTTFTQRAPEAAEFDETTQNKAITPSRSFKVTDFGTNRKAIYHYLFATNTNLPLILYRFQDAAFVNWIAVSNNSMQRMVVPTSNLVGIFIARVEIRDTLSRSVDQEVN